MAVAMTGAPTTLSGKYSYSPPGVQSPADAFNYSDMGNSQWNTYAPGVMAPVNEGQFNSQMNVAPNSAQQSGAMQDYINNSISGALSPQAQVAPLGVIGSPQAPQMMAGDQGANAQNFGTNQGLPPVPDINPLMQAYAAAHGGQAAPNIATAWYWAMNNGQVALIPDISGHVREYMRTHPGAANPTVDELWSWFSSLGIPGIEGPGRYTPTQPPPHMHVPGHFDQQTGHWVGDDGIDYGPGVPIASPDPDPGPGPDPVPPEPPVEPTYGVFTTQYDPDTMAAVPDLTAVIAAYRAAHNGNAARTLHELFVWDQAQATPLFPALNGVRDAFIQANGRDPVDIDEIWMWLTWEGPPVENSAGNPLGIPPSLWDTMAPSAKTLIRDAYVANGGTATDFDWGIELQRPGGNAARNVVGAFNAPRSAF